MGENVPRRRFNSGEFVGSIVLVVVLVAICAVVAGGAYFGHHSDKMRWIMCGIGAVLLAFGVPLARTCILGVMGVLMICIGAGFVLGNVAAFVWPAHAP